MNNCFIILASGQSKRFKSNKLKQFTTYRNKLIYEHSVDKALNSKLFKHIIIVVKNKKLIKKQYPKIIKIIKGGDERSDSSLLAIKYIKKFKPKNVLIHDAARPNFSIKLLYRLIDSLKKNKAVVPSIISNDSIKYFVKKDIYNLKRRNALLTQTPQAFRFKDLFLLATNNMKNIQDEASLFIEKDMKIKFINGELSNSKITDKEDLNFSKTFFGIGFDVHRLVPRRKLYLGGVKIPSKIGTLGHSDGDPVLHAITDAILGACKMGDIGERFSDKNKRFKNIRSTILLNKIIIEIQKKNILINNLDVNIITQKPKLHKYKKKIALSISKLCKVPISQINIKGKTTEKLGLIGKEKAIACEVIASIIKDD
jgi:2-C-methyl-D-erythritol 4-phosphate cytidylyltransferase / 2-C-methyl-D-erythritol 2,4-cyclodiphosphate synthase